MCLSTVYRMHDGEKQLVCKNVAAVRQQEGALVFTDIMGVQTRVEAVLDVEMSIPAQFVDDVAVAVKDRCPIETCLHAGGEIMGRGEVMDAVRKLLER